MICQSNRSDARNAVSKAIFVFPDVRQRALDNRGELGREVVVAQRLRGGLQEFEAGFGGFAGIADHRVANVQNIHLDIAEIPAGIVRQDAGDAEQRGGLHVGVLRGEEADQNAEEGGERSGALGLVGHGKWNSRILHEFCVGEENAATDGTDLFAGIFHVHHDFGERGEDKLNVIGVLWIQMIG